MHESSVNLPPLEASLEHISCANLNMLQSLYLQPFWLLPYGNPMSYGLELRNSSLKNAIIMHSIRSKPKELQIQLLQHI